jgi:hypothetical protein
MTRILAQTVAPATVCTILALYRSGLSAHRHSAICEVSYLA